MKALKILFTVCLLALFGQQGLAQKSKSSNKTEEQKIEYRNENGVKKLTITTDTNGKIKKEVYEGEEAEQKLNSLEKKHDPARKVVTKEKVEKGGDHFSMSMSSDKGKMTLKKVDKHGNVNVEEIDISESITDLKNQLRELFSDSSQFHFEMDAMDSDLNDKHKEFVFKTKGTPRELVNREKNKNTIVIRQEETLTPDEINTKYGVDVSKLDGKDTQILIKKMIKVKQP